MFQASNIELDFFAYTPYSMNHSSTTASLVLAISFRSSRRDVFCQKGVLKNFAKFA